MGTFCIHIGEAGADGYPVGMCLGSCHGPAAVHVGAIPLELPPLGELPAQDAVLEALQGSGDTAVSVGALGGYLHDLLQRAGVADAWAEQRKADPAVRTLLDIRAPDLDRLPWELLSFPDQVLPFRNARTPSLRVRLPMRVLEPITLPVRVLVVVGDPADPRLAAADELHALYAAVAPLPGQWHVELMRGPSKDELFDGYASLRPHILHVIAHGVQVPERLQEPALLMRNRTTGAVDFVTTVDVANEIPAAPPRLVVLNACRSATPEDRELARSLAGSFLEHGSDAVISMQGDVRSASAASFVRACFGALVEGAAVDVAVARARERLQRSAASGRDWALPRLTACAAPDQLLARVAPAGLPAGYPDACGPFGRVRKLVDHSDSRLAVWEAVDRVLADGSKRLVMVHGDDRVGKAAVARSALLTCHLMGRRVAMADLGVDSLNFDDALRRMRDLLRERIGPAAMEPIRRFDHALAYLSAGHLTAPADADGRCLTDNGAAFNPRTENVGELVVAVFQAFRTMLAEIAADRPLTLAVRHLSSVVDLHGYVVDHLLRPIATDPCSRVQLILTTTTAQADTLLSLGELAGHALKVPVDPFDIGDLENLVREYCARSGEDTFGRPWLKALEDTKERLAGKQVWLPYVLRRIEGFVKLDEVLL